MKDRVARLADAFKTLGDENRLRILDLLAEGEKTGSELLEKLPVSQPTLSHHMKLLCDASLVAMRKSGKWVYYSLSRRELSDLSEALLDYVAAIPFEKAPQPTQKRLPENEVKSPKTMDKNNPAKERPKQSEESGDAMPAWLF